MCRDLHKLPNDPLIQSLEPRQIDWIVGNLLDDAAKVASVKKSPGFSTVFETG